MIVAGLFVLGGCIPAQPGEAELSRRPAAVGAWADRLTSDDPNVSAAAADALVKDGNRSLPLLRRLLGTRGDEKLHGQVMEIAHRIGPEAVGLLADMLEDSRASIRRRAIDVLIDLAPDTVSIQPTLRRALKDDDVFVARDAARALGALGERAGPSVLALVEALSHEDPHVRVYAAEALASVGPAAAAATPQATAALVKALRDPFPGVRWGACEALASIGPAAAPAAVPGLIEALNDEYLYVRICAAGALGSIGPQAGPAIDALKAAAAEDPTLCAEAEWALNRIAGADAPAKAIASVATAPARPKMPSTFPTNAIGNPPLDWDTKTGRNIAWSAELGDETLGRPVVAGGVVYVGTDNRRPRDPDFNDECGVLMAFAASDGAFRWQDLAPRVKRRGLGEFLLPSTTSAPYVDEGNRLYYVTAECQLRCLDARSGRILWELDMCERLGVFPHEASNSDVLPIGNLLIVATSNGRNESHTRMLSPRAPSLIAVDKLSGEVVWSAVVPGENVLHGQWCSPTAANVGGRTHVLFGGGDGWLRAYDAASGREIWRFDGNPKDARWLPRPGVFSRSPIIASPACDDSGRVFVAMGDDPSHSNGPSLLHAIRLGGEGDVTDSRLLWTSHEIGRVVGTPIVKDGLLYVGDLGGNVSCLDSASGALVWKQETDAPIWGCLLLAGGRVYAGNTDGRMTVLRAGRRKEALAEIEMGAALYSRPAVAGDALYLATARRLYMITAKP